MYFTLPGGWSSIFSGNPWKLRLARASGTGVKRDALILAIVLAGPADQDVVPVDLQIRGDANAPRARRKFAGEIGGHGARAAGGKSHVIDHADPLFFPLSARRNQRFDIRRNRPQVRLIGGVHAGRRVIFDLAMHQQPQRAAAVWLAKIKFQAVRLGESHE